MSIVAPPPANLPTAVRTRSAAEHGISRRQLAGPAWPQLSHGLHASPGTADALDLHCAALRAMLPDGSAFAHATGAALRGWPVPGGRQLPVMAATPDGCHVQRAGAYVRRLQGRRVEEVNGLPVLSPAGLLLDLACDLELVDLVCVVDAALRQESLTAARVLALLPPRSHGGPRLRRALRLSDPRAESVRESALRMLLVLTGITSVDVQVVVRDAQGIPIARADLMLTGTRRLVEYDGSEHRSKERQRRDLARDRALQRAGWQRYGYSDDDLVRTPGAVIRDAEAALGVPHLPSRERRWLAHARRSTLTPEGRRLLDTRYARYWRAAVRRHPADDGAR
jgi:very-short-patch-repair endonuclease